MFVLGVGLAALSALISSVALLIMKRSADIEVRPAGSCGRPFFSRRHLNSPCPHLSPSQAGMPLRRRKRWILGFVMNTASEARPNVASPSPRLPPSPCSSPSRSFRCR